MCEEEEKGREMAAKRERGERERKRKWGRAIIAVICSTN